MIQLSTIANLPHGAVRPALLAGASPASFALTLGATTLADPAAPPSETAAVLLPDRQADAEPGKFLPATPQGDASEADPAEKTADADPDPEALAYAWFPLAQQPMLEAVVAADAAEPPTAIKGKPDPLPPAAAALPKQLEALEPEAPGTGALTISVPLAPRAFAIAVAPAAPQNPVPPTYPDAPQPVTATTPVPVASDMPPRAPAVAAVVPATPMFAAPQAAAASPLATPPLPPGDFSLAAKPTTPPAAEPRHSQPAVAAVPTPVAPAQPGPQPLARAAAVEQAFNLFAEQPRAPRREALRDVQPAALASAEAPRVHVAPAAQTGDAMLDLRRREWAGQMVEQIEALRDAAPTRETRIRLAPEALGTVDVSIRHDGDRIHVHFATETPAARQAIADAQPRLAEIAEARGLKLGQTSVDTGTAGQGSTPQGQGQRAALPRAPLRAGPIDTTDIDTDDRIA